MNTATRFALAAAAVVILAFIGLKFLVSGDNVGGPASPTPAASPAAVLGAEGTQLPAGTYKAGFEPSLTFTVDEGVVSVDCGQSPDCHGTTDVNQPGWLDVEFGAANGSELMVVGIAKVHGPSSPGTLIDPPADPAAVAALYVASPGVAVLQAAKTVTVGGVNATQVDVWAHQGLSLGTRTDDGSDFTIATEHETRMIIVVVNGQTVVITEQIGPKNRTRNFQAVLDMLQSMLDSITWQ